MTCPRSIVKATGFWEREVSYVRSATLRGFVLLILALAHTACFQVTYLPETTAVSGADGVRADGCPLPAEGQTLLVNETHGFCLLYPVGYAAAEIDGESWVYVGAILNAQDSRLHVQVAEAGGRTADEVAQERLTEIKASLPDLELAVQSATLAGRPAALLDGMPAQEFTRQIMVVHGDRVFTLVFMPDAPALGDPYQRMLALYELAVATFRFTQPAS